MRLSLRFTGMLAWLLLAPLATRAADPPEQTIEPYSSKVNGAILVKGETKDWFDIWADGFRKVQAPRNLNGTEEIAPGTYEVLVNKTKRVVKVEAGKKVVLLTGTLVVEGDKASFYAPYQDKERKCAGSPPLLNRPIALFAGNYAVDLRVGDRDVRLTEVAQVVAGKRTVLKE